MFVINHTIDARGNKKYIPTQYSITPLGYVGTLVRVDKISKFYRSFMYSCTCIRTVLFFFYSKQIQIK